MSQQEYKELRSTGEQKTVGRDSSISLRNLTQAKNESEYGFDPGLVELLKPDERMLSDSSLLSSDE